LFSGLLSLAACAGTLGATGAAQRLAPQQLYATVLNRSGGQPLHLEQYRGQVLMIDFFATWSQPSIVAIPRYKTLWDKHRREGLALVGIALDELGDDLVAPFVAGMQIPYPVALASPDIQRGASVFGPLPAIPTLMIFDRRGWLAVVFVGLVPVERIEAALDSLL
jgi:thiol-disulfide isomerase/thioredoxin